MEQEILLVILAAAARELQQANLLVNADRKMTPIGITGTPPGH